MRVYLENPFCVIKQDGVVAAFESDNCGHLREVTPRELIWKEKANRIEWEKRNPHLIKK
jgi:hypothetical protein